MLDLFLTVALYLVSLWGVITVGIVLAAIGPELWRVTRQRLHR